MIEAIKKKYPIRDENDQPATFPTFGSQVFGEDEEKRALWQAGKGFYADDSKKLNGRTLEEIIPSGGTAGQVLTKASDEGRDVQWADPFDGIRMELLYENPSPTSTFAPTTLNVYTGVDDGNFVMILYYDASDWNYIKTPMIVNGLCTMYTTDNVYRDANVENTKIGFSDAYKDGKVNNTKIIPYRIYAIRGMQK